MSFFGLARRLLCFNLGTYQIFLYQPVLGGAFAPFRRYRKTYSDVADVFYLLILGMEKFRFVLRGNHAIAIVYGAFDQQIAGVKAVLGPQCSRSSGLVHRKLSPTLESG